MRQFVTQSGWFLGQLDEPYHFADRSIEGVAYGARQCADLQILDGGAVKTRPAMESIVSNWMDIDDGAYLYGFPASDYDWVIAYLPSARTSLLFEDTIYTIRLDTGAVTEVGTIGGVTSAAADAVRPHFVRRDDTLLVVTDGAPPVQLTYSSASFSIDTPSFYREAAGTSIRLVNGSPYVIGQNTAFSSEFASGDTIRILGQDLQVAGGTPTVYYLTVTPAGEVTAEDLWLGETITGTSYAATVIWAEGNKLLVNADTGSPSASLVITGADSDIQLTIASVDATASMPGGIIADHIIQLSAAWDGPSVELTRPPARLWCDNTVTEPSPGEFSVGLVEFSAKGAAAFQGRVWFINTQSRELYDTGIEFRPTALLGSSTYDPFVLVGSAQVGGDVSAAAPIGYDLSAGNDSALQWIVGGDTLTIGGTENEYVLATGQQAVGSSGVPQPRIVSHYGSQPDSVVSSADGRVIFVPQGGGDLVSINPTEQRYQAKLLNPFAHSIVGSTVGVAVTPRVGERSPRIAAVQSDGSLALGFYTAKFDIPGWSPVTVPDGVTAVDAVQVRGETYIFLRRATNKHTLAKLVDSAYALDLKQEATAASSAPSTDWELADAELWSRTVFVYGRQTFYKFAMNAGSGSADPAAYEIGELVSQGGWSAVVYGVYKDHDDQDYLLVAESSGTVPSSGTITGATSGTAAVAASRTSFDSTRALEEVAVNGSGEFSTTVKLDRCWAGIPIVPVLKPLNIDGQDQLGMSRGRPRRVVSARVRYANTMQMYIRGQPIVEGAMVAPTSELPENSGVARRTFIGGWRPTDSFDIRGTVPYIMTVQDVTYEVVS